jgi:hypothetical protein
MIAATGGSADDVGKLATGEFYFKTENPENRSSSARRSASLIIRRIHQPRRKL